MPMLSGTFPLGQPQPPNSPQSRQAHSHFHQSGWGFPFAERLQSFHQPFTVPVHFLWAFPSNYPSGTGHRAGKIFGGKSFLILSSLLLWTGGLIQLSFWIKFKSHSKKIFYFHETSVSLKVCIVWVLCSSVPWTAPYLMPGTRKGKRWSPFTQFYPCYTFFHILFQSQYFITSFSTQDTSSSQKNLLCTSYDIHRTFALLDLTWWHSQGSLCCCFL